MIQIALKQLPNGKGLPVPNYASEHAAGLDVVAAESVALAPGERRAVETGIAVAIPEGYEIQVRARSGTAVRDGITCLTGTIDSDYRGEVKVVLINLGQDVFEIARGQRIAQLVPAPVLRATFEIAAELPATSRGAGGFGSTGQ